MEKMTEYQNAATENILDPSCIHENLLLLRRRLMLSQGEFIAKYLSSESGKPLLSISKLSNIETKGGKDALQYSRIIADKLSVDANIFQLSPDAFAKNIELFIETQLNSGNSSTNITDLAHMVQKTSYVETLVHVMCDYLTDSLIAGNLKPGDKLPSDRNLAVMFGVGRTAIREALKVLSVLGLVRILPGQGTFVSSSSSSFLTAPLSWTFLLGEHNLEHILTVREMLEDASSRLSATYATEADIENLTKIFNAAKDAFSASNFQQFLEYDIDFHLAIAKCSHNPIIYNLLLTSRKLITHISKSGMVTIEDLIAIDREHTAIYESIVAHDSVNSNAIMRRHLESSARRYHL